MDQTNFNRKDTAYSYIRGKILNCEYYPGQTISDRQIAAEIGVGRTPVREALITLHKENLVDVFPRKETCAKVITASDVIEIYQLRKIIEPTVATKFKRNINSKSLMDFSDKFNDIQNEDGPESNKKFYALDIEFHQFIIAATENKRLVRLFSELMQNTYRIGILSTLVHSGNPKKITYQEHNRIVRAILMENDAEIEEAIVSHINRSLISAMETINVAAFTPDSASGSN